MTTQTKTERSSISFRVCEGEDNAYVGTHEGVDSKLFCNQADIFFLLHDDSFENTQHVVDFLNTHIKSIGITAFSSHPMFEQMKG